MKKILRLAVAAAMLGVAAPASAAEIGSMKDAPLPPPIFWTGFYLGVNAGYGAGWTREDVNGANDWGYIYSGVGDVEQAAYASQQTAGFLGGVQGGYNWQVSRTVMGLEADLAWANVSGSTGYMPWAGGYVWDPLITSVEQNIEWLATFRARAGYLPAPNFLLYLTGGLALGDTTLSLAVRAIRTPNGALDTGLACAASAECSRGSASDISTGYVIGAGLEYLVAPGVTMKGEYLYADLGSRSVTTTDTGGWARLGSPAIWKNEADFATNIFRVGLNFKLSRWAAPVEPPFK